MTLRRCLLILVPLAFESVLYVAPSAAFAQESIKDVLAAQIRSQGTVCDKPKRAVRDAKRSKPDHEVWVLTCENATYRVSRYPDLAAKVERLR